MALKEKYKLPHSGDLDWHLGIKFTQDHENGTISLDQTVYIEVVLKRFNMEDSNDKYMPLEPQGQERWRLCAHAQWWCSASAGPAERSKLLQSSLLKASGPVRASVDVK
jgi:hypothetical protein